MKKDFSNTGLAMSLYLIMSVLIGMLFSRLITLLIVGPVSIYASVTGQTPSNLEQLQLILDALTTGDLSQIVYTLPVYFIVIPLVLKLLNGRVFNADEGVSKGELPCVYLIGTFFIVFFLGIVGNLMGQIIVLIYEHVSGTPIDNLVEQNLSQRSPILLLIVTVILTPLFEEIIYRYGVISKIGRYGDVNAILFSSVIFCLAHRNIFQLFYTFFAGLVFGYVYVYTRKLRYSVFLHMMFNLFGAFLPMMFASDSSDVSTYSKAYTAFEYGIAFIGLIILIFILLRKRLSLYNGGGIHIKESYLNAGMGVFFIICMVMSFLVFI